VSALFNNATANNNTAIGRAALFNNTTGSDATAIGSSALQSNTTGHENTAIGRSALFNNTTAFNNTALGAAALFNNTTGECNTAMGFGALRDNTTSDYNTAIGFAALFRNTTGTNNTVLGSGSGYSVTTAHNVICIGADVTGANVNNSCYIGSIFGQTSSGGVGVFINNTGKLGTMTSSRRFKEEIKAMDEASEKLYALRPVTFRYKKEIDPAGSSQFGLVAEDVQTVDPDLVVRDKEGKPYSVRYDHVNAMLLNEFLKEHRTVQEQGATIAELKKQIQALTAGLQKVSAQLELSKPAPQTVQNNR
jgi:trimeric autotransporter adhesin